MHKAEELLSIGERLLFLFCCAEMPILLYRHVADKLKEIDAGRGLVEIAHSPTKPYVSDKNVHILIDEAQLSTELEEFLKEREASASDKILWIALDASIRHKATNLDCIVKLKRNFRNSKGIVEYATYKRPGDLRLDRENNGVTAIFVEEKVVTADSLKVVLLHIAHKVRSVLILMSNPTIHYRAKEDPDVKAAYRGKTLEFATLAEAKGWDRGRSSS